MRCSLLAIQRLSAWQFVLYPASSHLHEALTEEILQQILRNENEPRRPVTTCADSRNIADYLTRKPDCTDVRVDQLAAALSMDQEQL